MRAIILIKEQADTIKGRHGRYSEIQPLPIPDGNFLIPEDCLNDVDLRDIKPTIEKFASNIVPVLPLPAQGELVKAGSIYVYTSQDMAGYSGNLVKCVQAHIRTWNSPETNPALFSFFRLNVTKD